MRTAPSWEGRLDEIDPARLEPHDGVMDANAHFVAEERPQPADHLGVPVVALWLVAGSALVATAIVVFGWRRTLEIWAACGILLPLFLVGERIWYKHIRKAV